MLLVLVAKESLLSRDTCALQASCPFRQIAHEILTAHRFRNMKIQSNEILITKDLEIQKIQSTEILITLNNPDCPRCKNTDHRKKRKRYSEQSSLQTFTNYLTFKSIFSCLIAIYMFGSEGRGDLVTYIYFQIHIATEKYI